MRKAKGAPLTEVELATIKDKADEIAEAEKAYESAKEAEEIATENAEVDRLIKATVKDIEREQNPEDSELKLNSFLVNFLAVLFVPAGLLHQKTKLHPVIAVLVSWVAILILLFLAGRGIFRLLK